MGPVNLGPVYVDGFAVFALVFVGSGHFSSCSVVRFDELIMPIADKHAQSIVRIKWLLTDKKSCENKCLQPFDQRV